MDGFITIAASDSMDDIKHCADVLCTGENDEVTIQKVIDRCMDEYTCKSTTRYSRITTR